MAMIKRSRSLIEGGIDEKLVKGCVAEHRVRIEQLNKLDRYYRGSHDILSRPKKGELAPNNRVVCGFPKYITDTACGYMFGNPVLFKSEQDISSLAAALKAIDSTTHDAELGKDLSVFGVGLELMYLSSDADPQPRLALIDPRNGFAVYDDTVEEKILFSVTLNEKYNESGKLAGTEVSVYTDSEIYAYTAKDIKNGQWTPHGIEPHYFGAVPLIEYWNNEEGMGDFEGVITLVDAYDVLTSDRVNDKERYVDALLVLVNAELPEDERDENGNVIDSAAARMLRNRILELPGAEADAKYLLKALNETETQVLAKAIANDIHKFSQVPDFTDEQFSGNSSGVAIRYKLLTLENLAKIKERFFISGLKQRFRLFANILVVKGGPQIDVSEIEIRLNRTLPVNELETAQKMALLRDMVSTETLLGMLPSIENPREEAAKVKAEQTEKQRQRAEGFDRMGFGTGADGQ